ncbi:MAG: DUF357 domain-containing protein [Candidatus Bathyarchaeia archaeon]
MNEDVKTIVEKYIQTVESALTDLTKKSTLRIDFDMVESVVDSARRYLQDSKYYLKHGRETAALASASYAEGLLDTLRILGLVNFTWKRRISLEEA